MTPNAEAPSAQHTTLRTHVPHEARSHMTSRRHGSASGVSATEALSAHTTMIRAGVVESEAHDELVLERISPSLLRVTRHSSPIGFIEHVGRVYVALLGQRYDRAVEVAQSLDVSHAARALA